MSLPISSPPPAHAQRMPSPPSPRVTWAGLNHAVHSVQTRAAVARLADSASGDAVTVVVTGDSTSLDIGNDALTTFDTLFGMIIRKVRAENPGVTFRFINRGISGATWYGLATAARGNFPSWYTQRAQPWIDTYIAQAGSGGTNKAPDLVIILMGTNDNSSMGFANPAAVFAKFADTSATFFPTTPDIWVCTSMGRTTNPAFSTPDQNFGSVMAAGTVRQIARCGHSNFATAGAIYPRQFGLLDFGRMWSMTTLGSDPGAQSLVNLTTSQLAAFQGAAAVGTRGFTLPECDGDFDFTATFPLQGGTLLTDRAMRLAVGAPMVGGTIHSQFLLEARGTTFFTAWHPGVGAVSFRGSNATVAVGSDVVFRCTAKQDHLYLSINNTTVWDRQTLRAHGPFSPRFYYVVDGTHDLVMNLNSYRAGRSLAYAATMSDMQAWGDNSVGIKGTTGGNMINHPSSLYMQEVVAPVLEAQSFSFLQ